MTKTAGLKNRSRKSKAPGHLSALHISEGGQEYILYVMVPGMQRADFSLSVDDHLLTVCATRHEALHCYNNETENKNTWSESFTLPEYADTMLTVAEYRNGELQIHIPKREKPVPGVKGNLVVY